MPNIMLRHAILAVTLVVASMAALGENSPVQSINIKSSWDGLGEPRSVEISIATNKAPNLLGRLLHKCLGLGSVLPGQIPEVSEALKWIVDLMRQLVGSRSRCMFSAPMARLPR